MLYARLNDIIENFSVLLSSNVMLCLSLRYCWKVSWSKPLVPHMPNFSVLIRFQKNLETLYPQNRYIFWCQVIRCHVQSFSTTVRLLNTQTMSQIENCIHFFSYAQIFFVSLYSFQLMPYVPIFPSFSDFKKSLATLCGRKMHRLEKFNTHMRALI